MSNFIKRLSKSLAKLQQTVTDRLAITKHVAIFQQLEIGSQEEQDLMLATKDLQERFEEVEGLPLEVMKTMALILLDIQYVQTTKATGTEKVYSVNPVDPFEGNVETMLQYAKFLVDTHQPELTVSCMAVLLVKMASHNMAWRENESTQHGRYTLLHHYALFESIFPGKFIQGKLSDFMREKKILVKYRDAQLDKPIHHAVGFSGFQAKPAASMVNKLYCRRGKNLKNFIGDQIRSRLSVESKEEVKKLFDFFSSKCFFNEKGVMTDGNSVQLLLTHMELIQMMMNQDPQSEKYMFKIPKFEHEADIDCGPWSTLQLIPVRVKWNASCFRQGTDVEKYSVFNLNYYLNCPTMVQTLEGLTMVCYEMQIGTAKAFDALTRGHIKYDRERIFDTNANLKNFYDAVKVMKNLDAVPLNSESIQRFRAHYSAFPALTLVMNEKYVMTCSKPKQDDPLVQKIGAQGGNDIKAFNYQGSWGSVSKTISDPCTIIKLQKELSK